ncbi:MAG TPA: hypothetical protein VFQ91_04875 [Bryobacteraceae bacterium]|nr:hypothetical protein [Bryobacteraceae bacterium]
MFRILLLFPLWLGAADFEPVTLSRLYPLGGQAGTAVEVEILGTKLDGVVGVEFDSPALRWQQTTLREAGRVRGVVLIGKDAALGGHLLRVMTTQGPSPSLLFHVGQFPAFPEAESRAVPSLPVEIYGRLDGAADIDTYWFSVQAGERWVFDLLAMEHGSAVEARMALVDGRGETVAYNDDRDSYDENPILSHVFSQAGVYGVRVDQYRGPRGFTFGKNNAYVLRISQLPILQSAAPLGARRGSPAKFRLTGSGLAGAKRVYMTALRRAEYVRMTYPYTMPIQFGGADGRVDGRVLSSGDGFVEASFAIPARVPVGVWKLWVETRGGVAEGLRLVINDLPEVTGTQPTPMPYAINGLLREKKQRDRYPVTGRKGIPIHAATLATQLGGPHLDTVLTLRDAEGKKVAESDDVVAGWGGLLGNPDSSLFYTPDRDGPLTLEVRDRLHRGGEEFAYRLEVDSRVPGFQLFTTPENLTVRRGGTAVLKVHLVREMGFAGPVDIRVDGLPGLLGRFRADQLFEPNADGADMLIPEMEFRVQAPDKAGIYPLRIFGKTAVGLEAEAKTAAMIGPIYQGDWNFYRRPVAAITLTVVE